MLLGAKLRRMLWRVRRFLQSVWTLGVMLGAGYAIGIDFFPDLRQSQPGLGPVLVACMLATLLLGKLLARLRTFETGSLAGLPPHAEDARTLKSDLELGAALLVATYVTLESTGGLRSPIQPLVYLTVAFVVTFHRTVVGLALVLFAAALEIALHHGFLIHHGEGVSAEATRLLVSHLLFIGFAALAHFVFLQSEILRQRREHRAAIQREIRNLREEARDFRLISSSLAADPSVRSRAVDEERLAIGAVETIHETLFYTLELLKKSLSLHTCVLLWLDDSGELLKIKELVTDSDCVTNVPLPADAGALGTVVKNRLLVNLRDPKRSHLPYYSGPDQDLIGAFLGVPVMEDGHLRGVVCADRAPDQNGALRPFNETDEALLLGAARQMLRSIQSERVFAAVERAKYEHERFFTALSRLNRALTPEDVCAMTFEAAREIVDFDLGAITLFDKATRRHTVVSTVGDTPRGLTDLSFGENAGIISMVVKNKHFLPAGGEIRDKDSPVFTKKIKLQGMESLLVLPLICADEAIGSFAVASRRMRSFPKDKRDMLTVIANHVAVSVMNAQMYGRMQEMATTDGLTGLHNHRTFQEKLVDMLARADRTGGKQALILTDIDHFKKVNDTHGHPVGDQVLRGVADVVKSCVRKVDIAARYGGEEFAIVLEGTDLAGARMLAERIRAEVQKQVFTSTHGQFEVTLSLGIAVYPDDASKETGGGKALIADADQALYHAKHHGRNRACAFVDIEPSRKLKAL